jgi:hypothetical protein
VTVTGTGFYGGGSSSAVTVVDFGSTAATGYMVNSDTQLTATSPAGSAGIVDVTVTTPGGVSATSSADEFTFVAAPTVTAVSPATGTETGGQSVTVTGTGFYGGGSSSAVTVVDFGSTAATSYMVNSDTQLTAISPAGSVSTVDIRVTTPGGTSAVNAPADHYGFVTDPAPTVTVVSPSSGPIAGGTSVTVTGTGFYGGGSSSAVTVVDFGTTPGTSVDVVSATSLTVDSPAGSAGIVDVTVTTPGGVSAKSSADEFTFVVAPTVTAVSPTTGTSAGGTSVTVTGTSFTGATAVDFGTTAATNFDVVSATSLTATSPAESAGSIDVTVTTPGGVSAKSSADKYTFATALSVTTTSLAGGTVGTAYSATLAATGGVTPYTWTVTTGTLPAGLGLDASTGAITGTPTASGTSSFTVTVTDSTATTHLTATADLSIVITASGGITTASLPNGTVGTSYSATVAVTGGTPPYSWSITTGALPPGLTLGSSTGTVSGTPTTAGAYTFTVSATDSTTPVPETASEPFSITIAAAGSGSGSGTTTGNTTGGGSTSSGSLPYTGANIDRLLEIAFGAILLGGLLLFPTGRRRRTRSGRVTTLGPGLVLANEQLWSQWR